MEWWGRKQNMNSVRDTSDTQSVAGSVATTAVPQVKKNIRSKISSYLSTSAIPIRSKISLYLSTLGSRIEVCPE